MFTIAYNDKLYRPLIGAFTVYHSAFQQQRRDTGRCGVSLLNMILYRPL